jgi:hypothetical protein
VDEKLAEARRIIEHSDEDAPVLGAAAFWLLGEVDRLRKIEDGIENLIAMKKQIIVSLEANIIREIENEYYYGTNGVHDLRAKADLLVGEISSLEALLYGK